MAKGYWIARLDVHDAEAYKPYTVANNTIFKKYGGRFLTRGGRFETAEGVHRTRNVIIEFPDYETALACYRSPEYQENMKIRHATSEGDLVIAEGYDEPSS